MGSLFINWNINVDQVKTVIKAFTNCNLETALLTQGLVLIPCLIYELQVCITYIILVVIFLLIYFNIFFRNYVQNIALKLKMY